MGSHNRLAIIKQWGIRLLVVFALTGTFLTAPGLVLFGQQQQSAARSTDVYKSDAVIMVHSDLVLIPVTVTDRSGKTVLGLEKEQFQLFENAAQQEITHFAAEDAPISIGIVFDASDSMQPKMAKAREAVNSLLNNANPDDEFFLVRFSSEARLMVPMTSHVEDIRNAMGYMRISGTTALLDGVRLAMNEMQQARNTRKAIVIISDGEDNSSRWTVGELKSAVREKDILIYSIGIDDAPTAYTECRARPHCGAPLLSEISSETGGRLFEVNQVKQLPDVAAKIAGWLRTQYVLGYVPTHTERDGTYRRVELKVQRPKGFPKLYVIWRQGYYAPKE